MWLQYDIFAEYQFAHSLFGSLVECLAFLRRVNKSDTDLDLRFAEDPYVDRVAIDNTCHASVDTNVLQPKVYVAGTSTS